MEPVINFIKTDAATLCWVVAVIGCVSLFGYANKRVSLVHELEKQKGPDPLGQHNRLFALFFASFAGSLLSTVVLAYRTPLVGLVSAFVATGILLGSINGWSVARLVDQLRQIGRWRWSFPFRPVRIGLWSVGGLGTAGLAGPECLLSYLSLTREPFDALVRDAVFRLNGLGLWDWANLLVVVAVFGVGSALWQVATRIRRRNAFSTFTTEPGYSWKTDSLLIVYITLVVLLIGLTVLISFTPVSDYTFWLGYGYVGLAQLFRRSRRSPKPLIENI